MMTPALRLLLDRPLLFDKLKRQGLLDPDYNEDD
jgi:hypothetical protein